MINVRSIHPESLTRCCSTKKCFDIFLQYLRKNTCAGIYVFNKFTNSWTPFSELFLCRALLGNYLVSIAKNSRVFPFSCSKVYGNELISNIYWELFCFCFLYIFLVLLSFFMFPFFIFNCFPNYFVLLIFFHYLLSTFIFCLLLFLLFKYFWSVICSYDSARLKYACGHPRVIFC